MKILIYGINFSPELTGIGKYSGEMATWLVENGHDIRVITAHPYYPEWKTHPGSNPWMYNTVVTNGITLYRCPVYIPSKLNTLKRLLHLGSFALSSLIPFFRLYKWKPDIIICVAPTLLIIPNGKIFSKIVGSDILLHIQDFEIDAMLGLGLAKNKFFSKFATSFERWCLTHVNKISTISRSMMDKAITKGCDPSNVIFFPNWSEVERFSNVDTDSVSALRSVYGFKSSSKIILYSGNIGEKQGLELVLDVAEGLQDKDFIFLIIGQGSGKARLERIAKEKSLSNIYFKPLQPYENLPALLALADCHLVIQRKGAADAVLPSKLTNILAVGGNAVITAEENTELGRLCVLFSGIAECVEPESYKDLVRGILSCVNKPKINPVAQNYARKYLDKETILTTFIENISS